MSHNLGLRGLALAACLTTGQTAIAEDNGKAITPPMGWSSWSALETNIDEITIKEIAELQSSLLKSAGYKYVNVDGGWYQNPDVGVDANGRWLEDRAKFPSGMRALADYVHSLGLSFGLYVTPGIPKLAVMRNTPIENSPYRASDIALTNVMETTYLGGTMYAVDYSKPGSQEFVNSWANLFSTWGVDYLKLDAVGDENAADVAAWSQALIQTGRPIHFELANNLDPSYAGVWRKYSNGWRISTDIESYNGTTLTTWDELALRFSLEPNWLGAAGPGGWNDLDSLEIGGDHDGLSSLERQTMFTFWALSASPLIIGDDLRQLDSTGIQLLTNAEAVALDQAGVVASPINAGTPQQIWSALEPDGSYAIGLFNLGDASSYIYVPWSSVGFTGSASVRDVWSSTNVGSMETGFGARVDPHGSRLLRIVPEQPIRRLLASTAVTTNGASIVSGTVGPEGQRAHSVGLGGTLMYPEIDLKCGGAYDLTISFVNGDSAARAAVVTVNGRELPVLNFPGSGDWGANLREQGLTTTVSFGKGANSLIVGNPAGPAPRYNRHHSAIEGCGSRTPGDRSLPRQPTNSAAIGHLYSPK